MRRPEVARRGSTEDASRLNATAEVLARSITGQAPRAFEHEVERILRRIEGAKVEENPTSRGPDGLGPWDFRVFSSGDHVFLFEAKFRARPVRVSEFASDAAALQGELAYIVTTNVDVLGNRDALDPLGLIQVIHLDQLIELVDSGEFDDG